jgi:DNA-binding transcriptional MerR regulator
VATTGRIQATISSGSVSSGARDLGFTLDQVRALLELADEKEKDCCTVDALARDHLSEVDRKLADLKALRRELSNVIGQCKQGKIADCQILSALSPR